MQWYGVLPQSSVYVRFQWLGRPQWGVFPDRHVRQGGRSINEDLPLVALTIDWGSR